MSDTLEESEVLLGVAECILREAATLKRQGSIVRAQALSMRAKALAACKEKPEGLDQHTWEVYRCSNE